MSAPTSHSPAARLARDRLEDRPRHHGCRNARYAIIIISKDLSIALLVTFSYNFQDDSATDKGRNLPNTFYWNTGETLWPNGSATRTLKAKR